MKPVKLTSISQRKPHQHNPIYAKVFFKCRLSGECLDPSCSLYKRTFRVSARSFPSPCTSSRLLDHLMLWQLLVALTFTLNVALARHQGGSNHLWRLIIINPGGVIKGFTCSCKIDCHWASATSRERNDHGFHSDTFQRGFASGSIYHQMALLTRRHGYRLQI